MTEFEKAHRAIDELLTHFNRRENEPTETDFISYNYLKNQVEYLYKLMTTN